MYAQNYKIRTKEIIKQSKYWKAISSWVGRLSIMIMSILMKLIYRFNTIPIKISATFVFVDIDKPVQKSLQKEPKITKTKCVAMEGSLW